MRLLLNSGAEVNACNDYGWTPLVFAVSNGNAASLQVLLDTGADIRVRDNEGNTALDWAQIWGKESSPAYAILVTAAEAAGMSVDD
ncbi:hypothetical protein FACS189476_08280 [Spirochaetia bacterium]|nr:hypothetical protein FACS189476_08280 [Spirochaetia bacterium]